MEGTEDKCTRATASYVSQDEAFKLTGQRYSNQQYGPLYSIRLELLRSVMRSKIASLWPTLPVCSTLDLEEGRECAVIGTLYKHMQLKPSILDAYAKERSSTPLVTANKFVSEDDHLILEDNKGRVRLVGTTFDPGPFVTGVVLAVRGQEEKDGEFRVEEMMLPGLPPHGPPSAPPPQPPASGGAGKLVALVSGLELGGERSDPLQPQVLLDFLAGHTGIAQVSASVVRAVLAGNSSAMNEQMELLNGQALSGRHSRKLVAPVRELDTFLAQLASAMPVDLMPGAKDPANFSLPQQPLNRCLLPISSSFTSVVCTTNPHQFEVDGVTFLGCSGQNVDDVYRYSTFDSRLDILRRLLSWRHVAPTAPDTLGCYPFQENDPFVMEHCPHVLFCGNQPEFSTDLVIGEQGQRVRVICVPSFAATGEVVLVDLGTLGCQLLQFMSVT